VQSRSSLINGALMALELPTTLESLRWMKSSST
jgi:hypothetical protein